MTRKIHRQLTPTASPSATLEPLSPRVVFVDEWGEPRYCFDLGELLLPYDIACALAAAMRGHLGGARQSTQYQCWQQVKVFSQFLQSNPQIRSLADLTGADIGNYVQWLKARTEDHDQPLQPPSQRCYYVGIKGLFRWLQKSRFWRDRLNAQLTFPSHPFHDARCDSRARPRLSEAVLQSLLRECYTEIDTAWEQFQQGQRLIATQPIPLPPLDPYSFDSVLWQLHGLGNGLLPSQHQAKGAGLWSDAIRRRFASFRALHRYLHLTVDTLVPFYLAITLQCHGNPEPMRLLTRDCIEPGPFGDEPMALVTWIKHRGGRSKATRQAKLFDRCKRRSAPNLIDQVLAMTEPLLNHTPPRDKNQLFLVRRVRRRVGVIGTNTLLSAVKRFIARTNTRITAWNRDHPDNAHVPLPDFSPVLLRGSAATQLYRRSHDLAEVGEALGHARLETTERYVVGVETERVRQTTIAQLQARWLAYITAGKGAREAPLDEATAQAIAAGRQASGFAGVCVNPLAAPGKPTGQLCPRWLGCLNCPGLVIVPTPPTLARLLQVVQHFDVMRNRIDPLRWRQLYQPIYQIVVDDILPAFPETMYSEAQRLIAELPPLPMTE